MKRNNNKPTKKKCLKKKCKKIAPKSFPVYENCNHTKITENGKVVVINNPILIYAATSKDGSSVLNSCRDTVLNKKIPNFVLDPKYFKCKSDNDSSNNILNDLSNIIDMSAESVAASKTISIVGSDKAQLIDVNKLSETKDFSNNATDNNVLELTDDEVIFVKEYRTEVSKPATLPKSVVKATEKNDIRKNPVRNMRNRQPKRFSNDVLLEEDFGILDSTDDESEQKKTEKQQKPLIKLPKELPINVHERPEYNAVTQKIEPFDCTISEIQKKASAAKKTKVTPVTVQKKPKRKPVVRRKTKQTTPVIVQETVSLDELKPLVNSTTDMLKYYFSNSQKHKDIIPSSSKLCTFENKLEILTNQALLFSIVNNLDQRAVVDKFKHLNLNNEVKN